MRQTWYDVWNRRFAEGPLRDLAQLIILDGFDIGAGKIEAEDWQSYVDTIASMLGLRQGQSVFEIGCGSGAFLFALRKKYDLEVGGIDYAKGLIAAARQVMPGGIFRVCEAGECPLEPQYDYVIANSLFHYLSYQHAELVFSLMLRKARIGVAVLDIPDLATQKESEVKRRDVLTEAEYSRKYEGLKHTYFDRDWFMQRAKGTSFCCVTFDACVPNCIQNCFRFGVRLLKSDGPCES